MTAQPDYGLKPFDPLAPYRSPKAVSPDLRGMKQWQEAQPVFESIYYRFADIAGRPSLIETQIWARYNRCCH